MKQNILNLVKNLSHEEMVLLVRSLVLEHSLSPDELYSQDVLWDSVCNTLRNNVVLSVVPDIGIKCDFGNDIRFIIYKEQRYHCRQGSLSPSEASAYARQLPEVNGAPWHIINGVQGALFNMVRTQYNEMARANGFSEILVRDFVIEERAMMVSPFQAQTYIYAVEA